MAVLSGGSSIWINGSGANSAILPFSGNSASGARSVVSGENNKAQGVDALSLGGDGNITSGTRSANIGGFGNEVTNTDAAILGGSGNKLTGSNSTILGGQNLSMLGTSVLGFNSASTAVSLSTGNIVYLGDANVWLGNVTNTATELRFYEPNTTSNFSGAHYSAFKAGAQAASITYILPTVAPTATNTVLTSDASNNMSWSSASSLGAWSTTGNSGTSAATNFIGTTDAQPLIFKANNTEWMRMLSTGNVGIGCTAPSYKLQVVGDIAAQGGTLRAASATVSTTITACSDVRFKKNITPLSKALENVLKLQGVSYDWRIQEFPDRYFNHQKQVGIIAQDLEKVYPELVSTDEKGYKSVDYSKITPILVEAVKDLNTENEKLKADIKQLKDRLTQQTKITEGVLARLEKLEVALSAKLIPEKEATSKADKK